MATKLSDNEFRHKLNALDIGITVIGTYQKSNYRIAVKCDKCGLEWSPYANSLLMGHGCPKCAGKMQKTHAEFVEELRLLRDDVIIIDRYVRALQKAKFRCLKCGHEWDVTPAHILSGRGCPACAHSRKGASQRLTMELFLERLYRIDPNLVVMDGGMYVNYKTPMPLRCNACKYEYVIKPCDVLDSGGCPSCHRACTSFFEQFIYYTLVSLLGSSNVISRDKTAIGAELDIYIPDLKAAIEPGSWYWHKTLVERDREKHRLCKEKGIKLITLYDHYDEPTVPFDNCFVTNCDLTSLRSRDELIRITKTILSEFDLDINLNASEWEEIKRKAKMDSRRMTTEEFKKEMVEINEKVEIIGEYTKANDKIKARCRVCGHEWYVAPTTLRQGTGCRRCVGTLKITHGQFVERLNILQPNMTPLTEYVDMKTHIKIECKDCGYIWSTKPLHLVKKSGRTGCPKCSGRARRTSDEFIAEIARLSPTIQIIGPYIRTYKPLLVQCAECNRIWQALPTTLLKGSGCKSCKSKNAIRQNSRKVKCITTGEIFTSISEAARKCNVSFTSISKCCKNGIEQKYAGGQEWEYVF